MLFKTHFTDFGAYVLYAETGEERARFDPTDGGRAKATAYAAELNEPVVALTPAEAAYLAAGRNPMDTDPEYARLKRADPMFSHMAPPATEDDWEFEPED